MAVSGYEGIAIVNLNEEHSEPLILINSTVAFGQQAFFFKKEPYGLSIHFAVRREIVEKSMERHNWARMPFKPDFIKTL